MMFQSEETSIIAMKGPRFTRKTEFAIDIATSLRCPVLSLHNILDFVGPDDLQTSPEDLAFQIICQMAETNLSTGVGQRIVIDSPLSSQSHLDQLSELAIECGARLVIVECKVDYIYDWKTAFHVRLHSDSHKWYKANTWEDVEKAFREGCDGRLDGDHVSKLVVDPFSDCLENGPYDPNPLIDAVQYMIRRTKFDGPNVVEYHRLRHGHYLNEEGDYGGFYRADYIGKEVTKAFRSCKGGGGHFITNYSEEGIEYEVKCMACENQVIGPAYSCKFCTFALHKECAELLDDNNKPSGDLITPDDLKILLVVGYQCMYPQIYYLCSACETKEEFVDIESCRDCLFATHLKRRMLPTVIRHGCDEHFLSVVLSDPKDYVQCKACEERVDLISYSCNTCCVTYHYKCLKELPLRVEHEHGRHHHTMLLRYSSKEAEDYICDVCSERGGSGERNPKRWFYSCQQCPYISQLYCIDVDVDDDGPTLDKLKLCLPSTDQLVN